MKKILSFGILLLISTMIIAQQPPKSDMDKAMAEYNKMMQDPRLKKTIDSMGMKLPNMADINKKISFAEKNTTQKQKNEAMGIASVPDKDMGRIAGISNKILSDAELNTHIKSVTAEVENHFSPDIKKACDQVYNMIKLKDKTPEALANAACGSWVMGIPELGLYLMGKACLQQPGSVDNLNNYGAFLVMSGGEQLAIPILNKLNVFYPGNSTVNNNIGQAWYGLGDIKTAEKYLDTAIRIFPGHVQANLTKSVIKETQGNKKEAADHLKKAMEESISSNDESKLRKLGYPNDKPVGWYAPMPEDPLGLHKINPPATYWSSLAEQKAYVPVWDKFNNELDNKIKEVSAALDIARKASENYEKVKIDSMMKYRLTNPAKAASFMSATNPLMFRAQKQMDALQDAASRKPIWANDVWSKKLKETYNQLQALRKTEIDAIDKVHKDFEDKFGEGKENPFEEYCSAQRTPINAYLSQANPLFEKLRAETLEENRRYFNQYAYFCEYLFDDVQFVAVKLEIRLKYLSFLKSFNPVSEADGIECKDTYKPEKSPYSPLKDFDDIHCEYKTSFSVVGIGSITAECNKMTTIFEPDFLPIRGRFTENLNTGEITSASVGATYKIISADANFEHGKFTNGTIEVSKSVDIGKTGKGPVEVGVKGTVGVVIQLDKDGVKDVVLKGDIQAKTDVKGTQLDNTVKTNVGDVKIPVPSQGGSVTIDVKSQYGVNAGGSVETKGTLSGLGTKGK